MLSFWNDTLKNISQDQRKDKFIITVNKMRFNVPLSYALGISPLISEQILKDPTFRELEINDNENIEKEFSNFLQGKEIKKETFVKIGKFLKNKEMIKKWKKSNKYTKETVIEYIKCMNQINNNIKQEGNRDCLDIEDIEEEIKYIAQHLEEMKEEVKNLKEKELIYIIRNENISIKNEDTIWEIIKERIKEMKKEIEEDKGKKKRNEQLQNMKRILLENVKIKYLTNENFKEYIEVLEGEDFGNIKNVSNKFNNNDKENGNIWKQIQEILVNNITNILLEGEETNKLKEDKEEKCKNCKLIEHKEGKNFEGIIKYLDKYGENIHQQGIITITGSSRPYNLPELVINYEWSSYWNSDNNPGEWWEINFKKMKVKMNGYSLKSGNLPINNAHLKNWVIEGRNEGENWVEIDRQDNNDLNGPNYQHYYSISEMTKPYQYIRIKNIGKNHNGSDFLVLNNIEFYGEILEV